jgi:hypothetical protein
MLKGSEMVKPIRESIVVPSLSVVPCPDETPFSYSEIDADSALGVQIDSDLTRTE